MANETYQYNYNYKYHDFYNNDAITPHYYEDKETSVDGLDVLEFAQKWYPCFYCANDNDGSITKPGASTGTLFLCLGSGCLNDTGSAITTAVGSATAVYEDDILKFQDAKTETVTPEINEREIFDGVFVKFLPSNMLFFSPTTYTVGSISIGKFLEPGQAEKYQFISSIPIFYSWDVAQNYASTGVGTPDIPGKEDETDRDHTPDEWEDDNADHDNLDDNDTIDTPVNSPLNVRGAVNCYVMSDEETSSVFRWFWNGMIEEMRREELLEYLTGVFGDMGQTLVGVQMYPFNVPRGDINEEVILGRFKSSLYRRPLATGSNLLWSFTTKVERKLKNFLDFAPYTKLMVYLPFIGIRSLDTNQFMGRTITVKYFVDYTTGGLDVYLFNGNTVVEHFTGQIGCDVPFSLDSGKGLRDIMVDKALENASSVVGMAGAGVGMAVGGPTGAMVGGSIGSMMGDFIGEGIQKGNSTHYSSTSSNANIMNSPRNLQLWTITPQYYVPKNADGSVNATKNKAYKDMYGRTSGYVLMRNKQLKDIHGYTICNNVKIDYGHSKNADGNVIYPTDYEKKKIKELLESGCFL